jgi:hypothetical protein
MHNDQPQQKVKNNKTIYTQTQQKSVALHGKNKNVNC